MERAILSMVLLMFSLTFLEAREKFKFSPNSCLVPGGSLILLQRLWKVRLFGCMPEVKCCWDI
jgi:hypothetical protein